MDVAVEVALTVAGSVAVEVEVAVEVAVAVEVWVVEGSVVNFESEEVVLQFQAVSLDPWWPGEYAVPGEFDWIRSDCYYHSCCGSGTCYGRRDHRRRLTWWKCYWGARGQSLFDLFEFDLRPFWSFFLFRQHGHRTQICQQQCQDQIERPHCVFVAGSG